MEKLYKGYLIEIDKGGWGWNISVTDSMLREIFSEVGYEKKNIAIEDAKYAIDECIDLSSCDTLATD